jgi:hypothetical protein
MILGYTYRLDDISQRLYYTFQEAIMAIDMERMMRNEDGKKLNSIVYIMVLKNICDEYITKNVNEEIKQKAIDTYKKVEERKAAENKKYHMYQY